MYFDFRLLTSNFLSTLCELGNPYGAICLVNYFSTKR
jgi:hypothetical protein